MGDQSQEMREHIKFWTKFSQKSEEILKAYNNLSDKNKRKANVENRLLYYQRPIL